MKKEFTVIIEQDEDGLYLASVSELEGCHTQAKTLDELRERVKEAIQLYLEVETYLINEVPLEFVGIQKLAVLIPPHHLTPPRALPVCRPGRM